MSIEELLDLVFKGTDEKSMMDILEIVWWLMAYVFYLYLLVRLTVKDCQQHGNKMGHHPAKLLLDVLLVSGALWLWSNVLLFIGGGVVCYLIFDHIQVQGSDTREFYEYIYLYIRMFTGLAWLWNRTSVLFPSLFASAIFAIVVIVRNGSFTPYVKQEACTSYPLTTAPLPHLVQDRYEENRFNSCGSDLNLDLGSSRNLWSVMAGQNVNASNGIQTVGDVRIGPLGLHVEFHGSPNVIVNTPSVLINGPVLHRSEPENVGYSHGDIYELPQHSPPISSIPSRNKTAQKVRNMLQKLKR